MTIHQTEPLTRIRARNYALILEAAESVFARHGYRGGSLQMIADAACLPKANIVYYFGSKQNLYQTILTRIVNIWENGLDKITPNSDPAEALDSYIREKIEQSRRYGLASKIFSSEIIQGAPNLDESFWIELREWMDCRVSVIQSWIEQGRMASVNPRHLLFMIWSGTQQYADYSTQLEKLMPEDELNHSMYQEAANNLSEVILRGCGLTLQH